MATVRMSEKLKEQITHNAGRSISKNVNAGPHESIHIWGGYLMSYPELDITDDDPNFGENAASNFIEKYILPENYKEIEKQIKLFLKAAGELSHAGFVDADDLVNTSSNEHGYVYAIALPPELINFSPNVFELNEEKEFERFYVWLEIRLFPSEENNWYWPKNEGKSYSAYNARNELSYPHKQLRKRKGSVLAPLPILKWDDVPQTVQTYVREKLETQRDQIKGREFSRAIKAIVDSCTTLKQFLDIWPQGDNLVPTEYMLRHKEKVTQKQKTTPTTLSDQQKANLNVTLLRSKLGG